MDSKWAPIVLSPDGQVLDGRTRLNACIRSGATFDTLIVQGVDIAAFETIDSVRKRTLADVLPMRKEPRSSARRSAQFDCVAGPSGTSLKGRYMLLSGISHKRLDIGELRAIGQAELNNQP